MGSQLKKLMGSKALRDDTLAPGACEAAATVTRKKPSALGLGSLVRSTIVLLPPHPSRRAASRRSSGRGGEAVATLRPASKLSPCPNATSHRANRWCVRTSPHAARLGSRARRAPNRASLQCASFDQTVCGILADNRDRAQRQAPVGGDPVRQLRHDR